MSRKRSITLALIVLAAVAVGSGFTVDDVILKFAELRQRVETATQPFNASYFNDFESVHVVIFFDISEGELVPSDAPVQIRSGDMPYRSDDGGNLRLIYGDASGREIGRYTIEDPGVVRSCDPDYEELGAIKPIALGTTELVVPFDPAIAILQIQRPGDEARTFDVSAQMAEGLNADW